MKTERRAKLEILLAMILFGTLGPFVRGVPLPGSLIALARGVVGAAFLLLLLKLKGEKLSAGAIRANWLPLVLSGACLGFGWIFLFEAYNYTTVSIATLCDYMAPVFVILASPVVFKERLTLHKLCCVLTALVGMVCISGVLGGGMPTLGESRGILLGLGSGILYAGIILLNKSIRGISSFDRTVMQLAVAALLLVPYNLLTVAPGTLTLNLKGVLFLLILGVVHTGVTYFFYFGAIEYVPSQTSAIISYVDPVVAVLMSVLVLREPMSLVEGMGAVLILGAALVSELPGREHKN